MLITTCTRPNAHHIARAKFLATRLHATYIPRRANLSRILRDHDAEAIYVVSRHREEVRLRSKTNPLYIEPGLFHYKRLDSTTHPLLRAISPPNHPPPTTLLDATLGLAHDALHLASVLLQLTVQGCEHSPVLFSLLEEGLPRLTAENAPWSNAASRIQPIHAHAYTHLQHQPTNSIPVIYIDPMFSTPSQSSPTFDVLRSFAHHEPLSEKLLHEACRVASDRVVLKRPPAAPKPKHSPPSTGWNRRVRSRSVDYLIAEFVLENPTYEHPTSGQDTSP